jgi:purine nucleoside phosphorylase
MAKGTRSLRPPFRRVLTSLPSNRSAFGSVGSLREEISPGSFVLATQIIDRTKGIRPSSFFEGTSIVAHAAFGDPFSGKLVGWFESSVQKALEAEGSALFASFAWRARSF